MLNKSVKKRGNSEIVALAQLLVQFCWSSRTTETHQRYFLTTVYEKEYFQLPFKYSPSRVPCLNSHSLNWNNLIKFLINCKAFSQMVTFHLYLEYLSGIRIFIYKVLTFHVSSVRVSSPSSHLFVQFVHWVSNIFLKFHFRHSFIQLFYAWGSCVG